METRVVDNNGIELAVHITGSGPVILCVHGWPELWYSWRHQLSAFSANGYTVAAMDVRGYGGSSKPEPIAAYGMRALAGDVAAVARALDPNGVILFGHDWGAPIVWNTALLHPELVRAVAGLSVPYTPRGPEPRGNLFEAIYHDRFFYQNYFQAEGVVEAEVEADVRLALRKIYFALSGDAPLDQWLVHKPIDAALLDGLIDPSPFPAWLSDADLDVFVSAFEQGGFRGPFNRYRAQHHDQEDLVELAGRTIAQPACFIAGERDAVRHFVPGVDLYADPGAGCDDLRTNVIVPGMGHWIQQEAPAATNEALASFLATL